MTDDEVLALLDHLDEKIAQVVTPMAAALTLVHEETMLLRQQVTESEERQASVERRQDAVAATLARRPDSSGPALGELVVRVEGAASRPPSTRKIERDDAGNIVAIVDEPIQAAGPARWMPDR